MCLENTEKDKEFQQEAENNSGNSRTENKLTKFKNSRDKFDRTRI